MRFSITKFSLFVSITTGGVLNQQSGARARKLIPVSVLQNSWLKLVTVRFLILQQLLPAFFTTTYLIAVQHYSKVCLILSEYSTTAMRYSLHHFAHIRLFLFQGLYTTIHSPPYHLAKFSIPLCPVVHSTMLNFINHYRLFSIALYQVTNTTIFLSNSTISIIFFSW